LKGFNIFNINIAIAAVLANKFRAILTALGIIFGVAAVISMLAIGTGAKQEILEQIKLIGLNNLVIEPVIEDQMENSDPEETSDSKKFSPGLTLLDAQSIREIIPTVKYVSPEIMVKKTALRKGRSMVVKLVGVMPEFFPLNNFKLIKGKKFNNSQIESGASVCIIGHRIKVKFFSDEDPIGKIIKCGNAWLKVIGVLESKNITENAMQNLNIRNYNHDIYVPIKTALLRYRNRVLITTGNVESWASYWDEDEEGAAANDEDKLNYHQLDRLIVQVDNSELLKSTSEIIARMLTRRHNKVNDFEITIPQLLLEQQQKTKDIFNVVLGSIAGISLIVGGIGIMNIMLASVLERIKEIGLRLSIGATKKDVVYQFLIEAVIISVAGGITGIALGIFLAKLIMHLTGILTIITASSIVVSFFVSAAVGMVFGIVPARKAAQQDPIKSLRYE